MKNLGNRRTENYKALIEKLMKSLQDISANMSIKVHFLHSHLDKFLVNCGEESDEQGERFHQDIKTMDFCWSIKRDLNNIEHNRQSRKRKFLP